MCRAPRQAADDLAEEAAREVGVNGPAPVLVGGREEEGGAGPRPRGGRHARRRAVGGPEAPDMGAARDGDPDHLARP